MNRRRALLHGTALVPAALLALGGCYAAFDWREFSWPDGGFSVLLPGKPARETREATIGAHRLTLDLFSIRVEGASFGVGVAPLPAQLDDKGRAQLLADARDGFAKNLGGTPAEERIISVDGHLGREFRVEGSRDGRTLVLAARVVATDRRFHQLVVLMPKSQLGAVDVPLFLGSLKLTK